MSKKYITAGISLIAIIAIGTSVFWFMQYQHEKDQHKDPAVAAQEELKSLQKKISRLMVLPDGSDATVATVSDITKLKDQPFFKNATNGDKVLIYAQAKTAILYNPKKDLIVSVS